MHNIAHPNIRGKSVGWEKTFFIFLIVFIISFAYAIVRYTVIRNVSFENVPLFIANKSIALTATILIGLSYILGPLTRISRKHFERHLYLRKHIGISGFAVAALHAFMSLALLSPAYYPKFFDAATGKMTFIGETSMLAGILAFLIFAVISITSLPPIERHMHKDQWKLVQSLGYAAYVLVLLHVAVMGFRGWMNPESYKYGFASISLIAALVIVLVLVMRVLVMAMSNKRH